MKKELKTITRNGQEYYFDEDSQCWRMSINDGRMCSLDNETLDAIVDNCKEFLKYRNRLYIDDIVILMEKALEGVANKKDLTPLEQDSIKKLRRMIKGL